MDLILKKMGIDVNSVIDAIKSSTSEDEAKFPIEVKDSTLTKM